MVKNVKDILLDDFWIMPATPEYIEQGVPYITSKNIKNGKIDFSKANYISQDAYETISKNRPILVGDILISMIGTLGETAEVTVEDGNFYGQNMFLIRLNETEVNKRYFLNYFKSDFVKRSLASKQNQSTQKYLKANHIEDLRIPVLSLKEQQSIAETLDTIERIIINRKEELLKLDELIKARFIELFEKEEYKKVTVSSVLNTGFWLMPATPEFVVDGEVPYITSKNIKNRTIDFDNVKYISREAYKSISANRPTQKGDILISMIGTLGQTAVIQDDREFYGQNLYLLRLNNAIVNTTYFCEFFNSDTAQYELQGKRNQSTQAYLKANHVEDLILPLPPMELQEQFAAFVEQTDKSKFVVQKALDEAQLLFDSLMQKYFG